MFLAESDSRLLFPYARLIVNPLIQNKERKEKGDTAGHSFLCFSFFFVCNAHMDITYALRTAFFFFVHFLEFLFFSPVWFRCWHAQNVFTLFYIVLHYYYYYYICILVFLLNLQYNLHLTRMRASAILQKKNKRKKKRFSPFICFVLTVLYDAQWNEFFFFFRVFFFRV